LKGPVALYETPPAGFKKKVYRPEHFRSEMTWQEVQSRIFGRRAAQPAYLHQGYHLFDFGGILLGFERGLLVYADSTPPEPD
ncbi:MAG TPA: hypothetical protein VN328_12520, partial [Thermodesulfovibrionales bacterium]|nr:hypothetical protein [Thermodesulfovibrionales bacterium]